MKLLLRSDVDGVGKKGDIVEVKDGYARNYLVPKGFAIKATAGTERQAESMRRARATRDAADRAAAEEVARQLVATVVEVKARAGTEGKLFGSVTSADIADAISAQTGLVIDRRAIDLPEPIKTLGSHDVGAKLHADVHLRVTVEVVAS